MEEDGTKIISMFFQLDEANGSHPFLSKACMMDPDYLGATASVPDRACPPPDRPTLSLPQLVDCQKMRFQKSATRSEKSQHG
mmetsp:Transcript_29264/g.44263  ORF Transcript_29264/g.44263 Transcript_29264/m.44263 type:complete len:82 (-) Transcript_29264:119-364(-)